MLVGCRFRGLFDPARLVIDPDVPGQVRYSGRRGRDTPDDPIPSWSCEQDDKDDRRVIGVQDMNDDEVVPLDSETTQICIRHNLIHTVVGTWDSYKNTRRTRLLSCGLDSERRIRRLQARVAADAALGRVTARDGGLARPLKWGQGRETWRQHETGRR